MPRLPEILDRNALPEDKRDIYDYLAGSRGSVRLPFSAVLNAPEVCRRVSNLGGYIRFESSLPNSVMELATITVAREFNSAHEWAMHTGFARDAGASEAAIEAVAHRRDTAGLPREESLPIRYARELLQDKKLSDATLEEARELYGNQGVVELSATVGYYAMMACLIATIDIVPPENAPKLP